MVFPRDGRRVISFVYAIATLINYVGAADRRPRVRI
jgi:hypothetical protein